MAVTFKPVVAAKLLNVVISAVLIGVPIVLATYFSVPIWVCLFVAVQVVFWCAHTARLFIAGVTFDDEGITTVGFTRRFHAWRTITKWSNHGGNNSIFFQLEDQSVHGFDGWCIPGARLREVAEILHAKLGEPAIGEQAVLPPLLRYYLDLLHRHAVDADSKNSDLEQ